MKSFAMFLLLENPLYSVNITPPAIRSLADRLFRPVTKIVEEDCNTSIGLEKGIRSVMANSWSPVEDANVTRYEYEHLIDLEGNPFTSPQLLQYIGEGKDTVRVRHVGHCASKGGICKKCYYAHLLASTSNFISPTTDEVSVPYYDTPPTQAEVSLPSIGSAVRTFSSRGEVKPYNASSQKSLFAYTCESFIGSIIGAKAYDSFPLPLKPSILVMGINRNVLDRAMVEVSPFIATAHQRFINDMEDPLYKALAIVILYLLSGEDPTAEVPTNPPGASPTYLLSDD